VKAPPCSGSFRGRKSLYMTVAPLPRLHGFALAARV
jgi:hypothetical protein